MEYLFHRHSDLYAGAKGQRRIGGRKTAVAWSCRRRRLIQLAAVAATVDAVLFPSHGGRMNTVCGKNQGFGWGVALVLVLLLVVLPLLLLCIHPSLRINKGNLG